MSHSEAVNALHAAQSAFITPLASGGAPSREATPALKDLAVALPSLDGAQRRAGAELLRRPTDKGRDFFGPEATASPICSANFCVHWTDSQKNAPSSPQFINDVIASTDQAFAVENGTLAWQPAKSDGTRGARDGVGGAGQVDVYITNLGRRIYGYAAPDPMQKGTRRYAFLVLDNDYVGFPTGPLESMQVTVAHEYNHILHFNYDTLEETWLFEDSAVWMEQQVYPEINDYLNYLPGFANGSTTPMTGDDIKIYAEAVWNHWLSSRYGLDVIRDTWGASQAGVKPPHHAVSAYSAAIKAHGGSSFSPEFGTFAAATAEWNSSSNFPDAAVYPDMKRQGSLGHNPRTGVLDNTSFALLNVKPGGSTPVTLQVKGTRGVAASIALVGREGPAVGGVVTTVIKQMPKGGNASVTLPDPARFTRITAVIVNADGRIARNGNYIGDGARYTFQQK